ncbi:MAG: DEAD/DEAH box helicase family protein [Acidobacteria bacterium]|nr:DEAD/DEAH box helicase family protein [Acidobacteriota bacterium]MCA1638968.1 DEAD/DEAH box helicase family protein [Acidobacteriota bacterium]
MFNDIIQRKSKFWLNSPDCKIKSVIEYIRKIGQLREPQIEAIEVYLFLKIAGENKPLWQLLSEGFFTQKEDLSKLFITDEAKNVFRNSVSACSIFEFVRQQAENTLTTLSPNEKLIAENASTMDFEVVAKKIFYGVNYADYLFSLPMGAGKTFLMAALMYLDLYFAQTEPENKLFAHNFLVLIPSGLKSSIIPSLKSIEQFEPSWVIPEPAASNLKRLIKFEVLDESKSAKKSNKAKNPNVQKIARHQPFDTLTGLIMVVNAEKVILDRLELTRQHELIEKTEDEKDAQANELRNFIGKIPNLQILIDEVHHATDSDIKLRQVVNKWNENGKVNSVLGFSGTPYLEKKEKIPFGERVSFESEQITNTVYYFPLIEGIKTFLKNPQIKSEERGLDSRQIITKGVVDFYEKYKKDGEIKIYRDGTCAKLAIYCGTIARLENEVYPFLTDILAIDSNKILKFHKGNKDFPQPQDSELDFKLLDEPVSRKEIILLVQIGKEGWDCRSLTGVILSQSGDCPKNMVLQTSCRCLRQVEKEATETALIWLSKDNADTLNIQLAEKQKTSINEINSLGATKETEKVERFSRLAYLKLPEVDFFQLKVEYDTLTTNSELNPQKEIASIKTNDFLNQGIITQRNLTSDDATRIVLDTEKGDYADFNRWLLNISKEGFGEISLQQLKRFAVELKALFEQVTFTEDGERFFNDFYDLPEINKQIRLAFHTRRELNTKSEVFEQSAKMLIVESLQAITKSTKLYPNEDETKEILKIDGEGLDLEARQAKLNEDFEKLLEMAKAQGLENLIQRKPNEVSFPVAHKDRTFHFLPYKFDSNLEKDIFIEALRDDYLKNCNLEIYFNGEKDITDFRILCYTENNKYVGRYTPDFMVIQRSKDGKIHRALIVETKGSGYAEQTTFKLRRTFVENEFLKMNNDRFGYRKFDYLYLTDADDFNDNLVKLNTKLKTFFCD